MPYIFIDVSNQSVAVTVQNRTDNADRKKIYIYIYNIK